MSTMTPDPGRVPAALVAGDAARLIELVRAQHHTSDTASGGFVCFGCTRTGWSVPFPCIYARLADTLEASQLDLQVAALRAPAALDPDRQRRLKKIRQDARVLETAIPRSMPILEKRMAREDVPWLLEELATAQQRTEALWGLVYDLSGEGGMSFRRTSDYQSYIQRAEQLIEADWPNSEPYVSKIHEDIRYLDAQLAAAHSELAALRASAPGREERCHAHRYATSDRERWFRDEDGHEVEIRPYPDGAVDEICTDEIHLEQMDFNNYWMRINGVVFSIRARGKITLTYEPDSAREVVVPLAETCEGNGCGFQAREGRGG